MVAEPSSSGMKAGKMVSMYERRAASPPEVFPPSGPSRYTDESMRSMSAEPCTRLIDSLRVVTSTTPAVARP